jgi:hypothetical protein
MEAGKHRLRARPCSAHRRFSESGHSLKTGHVGRTVILRSWSNHLLEDGINLPLDGKMRTRFIGVYSGRLQAKDNLDTQIGMVWPPEAINEIIACNMRDTD